MPRVLLVLPTATYRAPDFLAAARAVGAEVVVATEQPQTMAEAMGDRAVVVDLCDPQAAARRIAELHARSPLDAVVGVDEQGVLVAAHAAAALGLPHNPPKAVAATRDKAELRRVLRAAGLPQPRVGDDAGFPRVVKATGLSGSRGVIRADTPEETERAIERVRNIVGDPSADVLVEEYVPGAEVAVEGLLRDGTLDVLAIFDKPDPLEGPYFEETIYVTPSRLPQPTQDEIVATVRAACEAVGLSHGPIHAEVRLPPEGVRGSSSADALRSRGPMGVRGSSSADALRPPGPMGPPVLLEVAARSIGGLCSRALRFGAGISLEEVILAAALGRAPDVHRSGAAAGVMMIPIPRSGVLHAVGGVEEARSADGVDGVEITIPLGQRVEALPEGDRYLGFVFASGAAPGSVEAALRAAHARLHVVVDDGP